MVVDVHVVRARLRRLEDCVHVLRDLRALGRDVAISDRAVVDRIERNAQVAAQACADVALHVVSASGAPAPSTYSAAMPALAGLGVVPSDLADRLAAAVRLRNILVHGYLEVDPGRLFDELGWIEDAATFAEAVRDWLDRQAP